MKKALLVALISGAYSTCTFKQPTSASGSTCDTTAAGAHTDNCSECNMADDAQPSACKTCNDGYYVDTTKKAPKAADGCATA